MLTVSAQHPPPHQRYVVNRAGKLFTCTVCYGIHEPWWIVHTLKGEADPVPMDDTDLWITLVETFEKINAPTREGG